MFDYLLAGNVEVTASLLEELAQSSDVRVRARVAEHPNTPLPVLFKLSWDESGGGQAKYCLQSAANQFDAHAACHR